MALLAVIGKTGALSAGIVVASLLAWFLLGKAFLGFAFAGLIFVAFACLPGTVSLAFVVHRSPDIPLLRRTYAWAQLMTTQSILIALLAVDALTGKHLPSGAGTVILLIALLHPCIPLNIILVRYIVRGREGKERPPPP